MTTTSLLRVPIGDPAVVRLVARDLAAACSFTSRQSWLIALAVSEVDAEAFLNEAEGAIEFRIAAADDVARFEVAVEEHTARPDHSRQDPERLALARRTADAISVEVEPMSPAAVLMSWPLPTGSIPPSKIDATLGDDGERVHRENLALFDLLADPHASKTEPTTTNGWFATLADPGELADRSVLVVAGPPPSAQSAELVAERDRIAHDLNDLVIQRLFSAGLALQATLHLDPREEMARRLHRAIEELDDTIRQIRTSIFTLTTRSDLQRSLPADLLALAAKAGVALGFGPRVGFEGNLDTTLPSAVAEELIAVCEEALSNVARHAEASEVEVVLRTGDEVVLEISDDGIGMQRATRRNGFAGLERRAEQLGGSFSTSSRNGTGTHLIWRVPVSPQIPLPIACEQTRREADET